MNDAELQAFLASKSTHTHHTSQQFELPALQVTFPLLSENIAANIATEPKHLYSIGHSVSPSRASIHSVHSITSNITTPTGSGPQLKRKVANKHMRQHLNIIQPISLTPSINGSPSFSTSARPKIEQSLSARPIPQVSRVLLTRSNTAPSPKRPPASHSSCGVETTSGPPPSFDTRRTNSQERVWKIERSKSLRITLGSEPVESHQRAVTSETKNSDEVKVSEPTTPRLTHSSSDTADSESVSTPTDAERISVMDVRKEQGLSVSHSEVGSKTSSESHKSEDLFLNIARVNAARPSSSKSDKKRSRVSLPFLSGPRPVTSHTLGGLPFHDESSVLTPRAELQSYYGQRASFQFGESRDEAPEQELDASNSGLYSKRSSTLYADTIRAVQRPGTGLRNNRLVSEGGFLDKSRVGEQNATESTVSTTAPSTVWDELDDLKSRIRNLELTGKLPPSSAAAMSSAERPRTATTAATTMSGSPKHNKVPSQLQSTIEGVPLNVHPLLHEALGNAKAIVSHDVFQKLQATAQDALQLAALTSYDGGSVRSGVPPMTERQIRRRTESMCRSLTELAIALAAESKPALSTCRPTSRDHHISPSMGLRSRRYSQSNNEPTERPPVSARVQSRLESRRISTQLGYSTAHRISPDLESPTALPQHPASGSRIIRPSGQLRSRRAQGYLDDANGEEEPSPSVRPISRAMTDVSAARRLSRDHTALSREYTSQHPMPSKPEVTSTTRTPLPANLSTNFISRRKHGSPVITTAADSSPLAPRPSFGRISIIPQDNAASDMMPETPASSRSVSTRRSLGFASRLGSSVGNRLRAAKTERVDTRSYKEPPLPVSSETASMHATALEQ